jgi:hypothetical protein
MYNQRCTLLLIAALAAIVGRVDAASAPVTLEVLNPRGEITPPAVTGIRPRIASLAGKKIALIDNTKAGARNFLNALQDLLEQRYPAAAFTAPPKPEGRILQDTSPGVLRGTRCCSTISAALIRPGKLQAPR